MGVIWTSKTRNFPPGLTTKADPKHNLKHLWWASGATTNVPISAAASLVDAAGNATGVFGSGTGSNPSGNSVVFSSGLPAISFDPVGTGQLISTQLKLGDSNGSGSIGSGNAFSLVAAVWASSVSTDTVVIYGGGSGSIGLRFNNSGQLELLRTNQALLGTSTGTLTANVWNSVGVAYDGTNGVFYINGKNAGTFSTSSTFTHTTQHYLGAGVSSEWVTNITMKLRYVAISSEVKPVSFFVNTHNNPWQLFAPEKRPLFFSTGGGANNTGTLAATLDAATLTGVGGVTRSGTLATTLDAATLTGVGNVTRSGTLAVTLDAATLSGTGAVTTSGTLAVTLEDATLAGVGSVAVGTNRDGTLAVTLDAATLAGVGAVTRSGTLAVTLDAATLAGIGTAGQAITGTLGVTLDSVTLAGIGAIPAAPSAGGGKTFGSNKKKKKQRKAIESEEWLKAEETAKQLLQDRFTKTTPEAKLEALASHIESLQPVIEALKALAREDVQEAVQETKTEELTEHQLVLNRFDALEKKIESVEELLIILMADL